MKKKISKARIARKALQPRIVEAQVFARLNNDDRGSLSFKVLQFLGLKE